MKNRTDIMTDIETLGTQSDSTVFQVSAKSFNITTGEIYDSFNMIVDIDYEKDMKVDGRCLKWWLQTNKELLHKLINSEQSYEPDTVFQKFREWILSQNDKCKEIYLWGNGIKFDNVMIDTQMKKYGLDYPIFYRNDRDVRTILELASLKIHKTEQEIKDMVTLDSETKHDALNDVSFQIRLVCKCYEILMK